MKGGEFQSIFNLHELFISQLVQQVENPTLGQLKDGTSNLGKIYSVFQQYATHNLEDKTVNGQNCRKSA